ncbi:MAG: hypothetical protein ACI9HK_004720 [Pirellulaceae bacterium]|jgi:hypothetical protein
MLPRTSNQHRYPQLPFWQLLARTGTSILGRYSRSRFGAIALLSHSEFVSNHTRDHLYLRFDDVLANGRGKRPPTSDDIRAAVEFAASSENLMVCCRAGQSRSAATAFVIGCQQLGVDIACGLLNPKRHIPNSLIIELAAKVLDDPHLLQYFSEWQLANKQVRLSEYLDEIEQEFDELELQGARNRIVNS